MQPPVPPREVKLTERRHSAAGFDLASRFRRPFWERRSIKGNNLLSESGMRGREGQGQNITGQMYWELCSLRTQEGSEGVTARRQLLIWGHLTPREDRLMSRSWWFNRAYVSLCTRRTYLPHLTHSTQEVPQDNLPPFRPNSICSSLTRTQCD